MQTLLSTSIVSRINAETKLLAGSGPEPHLAVVLIGEDPQSLRYVELKTKRAKELGILLSTYHLPSVTPFAEIELSVSFLAKDPEVQGIIIQLPLPETITAEQTACLLELIPVTKDVDGLRDDWIVNDASPKTVVDLMAYTGNPLPPMVCGVISLFDEYGIDTENKKIVIVGDGRLVGKPLARYFMQIGLDVTVVSIETDHILEITRQADILISGTGQSDLITYQWVKEGVVIINCASDVHEDSVFQVASAATPAVGGIGPLTVAWLLHNVARRARE